MKKKIRSPGSATIINGIATGFGSAFGIGLDVTCNVKTKSDNIKCFSDTSKDTSLMEIATKNVFLKYGISEEEFGIDVNIKSSLPMASGLSSSSAVSNSITAIVSNIISEEFDLKPLNDLEIINLGIDSSLEAKVTITGAFDDATASYFGGITLTDNLKREIIIKEKMEEYSVLVYMPNYNVKSSESNVEKMKLVSPLVEIALGLAKKRDYFKALTLNGLIYSAALNFDSTIAIDALSGGALASGLSGTGPSVIAICSSDKIDYIKDKWYYLDGRVIETNVDNIGCKFI